MSFRFRFTDSILCFVGAVNTRTFFAVKVEGSFKIDEQILNVNQIRDHFELSFFFQLLFCFFFFVIK